MRFNPFTLSFHAYAGAADRLPVVVSIVFALERTACTPNQFVSPDDSRLPSKVQLTVENVPVQNIITLDALDTSPDTVPPATGVLIVACTAVMSPVMSAYEAGLLDVLRRPSSSTLSSV